MAKKVSKSKLASKLNPALVDAYEAVKGNETRMGGGTGNLPGGIKGGLAKLVKARFGEYKSGNNEGEVYLLLAGVVIQPKTFVDDQGNEIITAGEYTQLVLPLCATEGSKPKTIEENTDRALNELRKLGLETADLDIDEWEDAVAALQASQVYFKFSTSQAEPTENFPNPRVFENWGGAVDNLDEYSETEDEVEEVEEPTPKRSKPKQEDKPAAPKLAKKTVVEDEEEEEDQEDVLALAKLADKKSDEDAQTRLAEIAESLDIDVEELDSWADVAKAILDAQNPSDNDEEEDEDEGSEEDVNDEDDDEEDITPEKEEVYYFKPPKSKSYIECEVTAVFEKKKTVNLKSIEDGTLYKGIAWDQLETEV